jgi:hypothetical protein
MPELRNILAAAGRGMEAVDEERTMRAALAKAADTFESTGTNTGLEAARVLRGDPVSAQAYVEQFGGLQSLYRFALADQETQTRRAKIAADIGAAERERGAGAALARGLGQAYGLRPEERATLTPEELPQYDEQSAALARGLGEAGAATVEPAIRRPGEDPRTAAIRSILAAGEQWGVKPRDLLAALNHVEKINPTYTPQDVLNVLQQSGVPVSYLTEASMQQFIKEFQRGELRFDVLRYRDVPPGPANPDWGVESHPVEVVGADGKKQIITEVVPVPRKGSPQATLAAIKLQYLLRKMQGQKIPQEIDDALFGKPTIDLSGGVSLTPAGPE